MKNYFLILSLFTIVSCQNNSTPLSNTFLDSFQLTPIESPVHSGGEPNLFVSKNGQAYLSWVEYIDEKTDALMFSKLENERWTTPKEIARGNDWFVNWADFPSLVVYKNNEQHLAAHWLAKRAEGTYDYDIHISQSKNGGESWSPSFIIHRDSIAAEHGFVTMLPTDDGKIFATWLDGRFTKVEASKSKDDGHGHGHGGGAMTLRTATFDIDGNIFDEKELDNRICDCCQTTTTIVGEKTIVAFRDRSVDEIRDISFVQKTKNNWSTSTTVNMDQWKIAGCPVNGPAIASNENHTAIAWYTQAYDTAKVKLAFYDFKNNTFTSPIQINNETPLGRVGITILENSALVTWLEKTSEGTDIKLIAVNSNGIKSDSKTISKTSDSRKSGFPQIEKTKDKVIFAWTEADDKSSIIKTAFWKY